MQYLVKGFYFLFERQILLIWEAIDLYINFLTNNKELTI